MISPSQTFRQRGAALVIVLAILVLLTVLIVAFFAASQTETQSGLDNANLTELQRLRELPLEIVKTQIHGATTLGQTNSLADVTRTWASQPGLIRVFNNTLSTNSGGSLDRLYKLYSSSRMEETSTAFLGSEIPSDWPTQTNRYVNLNQPFPSPTHPGEMTYPILDPAAQDWAEGLSVAADSAGQTNAPMPVEWLYVLKDGSLVPQSGLTNAANPPTSRIAFWTDDESCKVNLNTAGERTFWDRPKAGHDRNFAFRYNQPSTGEYNAYPGHPATVSLSAVFGKALPGLSSNALAEAMLALSPRYAWGGSQNGSVPTYSPRIALDRTKTGSTVKNDRLFASPSEVYFTPARTAADSHLMEPLKKSDFLLTTSSRSPELNLFGLPRIGLWPLDTDLTKRTVYDALIARGTTIGSQPFYFQRTSPFAMDEATGITRNWALLQYLDRLTAQTIPGFGGKFSTKYGADGNRQNLTEMFDYVRALTNLCDTSRGEDDFDKQFTPALSPTRGYVLPTRIPTWNTRGFGRLPVVTNVGVVLYAYDQRGMYDEGYHPPAITLPDTTETEVHMLLWFNFLNPGLGVAPIATTYKIVLKHQPGFGLSNSDGTNAATFTLRNLTGDRFAFTDQGKDWGGYESMVGQLSGIVTPGPPLKSYEFHSQTPITITGSTMNFTGGNLDIEIYDKTTNQLLQTYTLQFPGSITPWPVPLAWQRIDTNTNDNKLTPTLFENRNPYKATYDSDENPDASRYLLAIRRMNTSEKGTPGEPGYWPAYYGGYAADVIRGIELKHGDARIVACLNTVPFSMFQPSKGYFDGSRRIACSLLFSRNVSNIVRVYGSEFGKFANVKFHDETQSIDYLTLLNRPPLPVEVDGTLLTSLRDMNWCGDIDAGMLGEPDGPFLNKPDEGFISTQDPATATPGTQDPYFRAMSVTIDGTRIKSWDPRENGFFSPTRQMPSAIQFGSLPANVLHNEPWRTLLFCPNSQAAMVRAGDNSIGHPGAASPPDYLYLDLFTMPTVEPYAISEPFSTAGKINLNQRLIPFTYIKRETGLHAVLKNLALNATPSDDAQISAWYKSPNTTADRWHHMPGLDVGKTLTEIANVLDPGGVAGAGAFRSAAEICNVFLIPDDQDSATSAAYWADHQLTADNAREVPYNYIYPLLTTQSNTYRVHYLVQTLAPLVNKSDFDPASDFKVTGEMQGSYLLERYLDINDPDFEGVPPAVDPMTKPLNEYYKFRVLSHRAFTPGA